MRIKNSKSHNFNVNAAHKRYKFIFKKIKRVFKKNKINLPKNKIELNEY